MFRKLRLTLLLLVLVLTSLTLSPVAAQTVTPINVNTNTFGEFTQVGQVVEYSLAIASPQLITVQVLAITDGVAGSLTIVNSSGATVGTAINNGTQPLVNASVSLSAPGTYLIRVQSVSSVSGQFLLTVQASAIVIPTQTLSVGQVINGQVDPQTTVRAYDFSTFNQLLILELRAAQLDVAPAITLSNRDTGAVLATSSGELAGSRYRLPATQQVINYRLEVQHSSTIGQSFTLCLTLESANATCGTDVLQPPIVVVPTLPPIAPTSAVIIVTPTQQPFIPVQIPSSGACQVATNTRGVVNIRSGPGLNFDVVSRLNDNVSIMVIGRQGDNSWYQVNNNGVIGFVAASVVRLGGQCGAVPIVIPTAAPTQPQISTATPTATASPTPAATLNFSLPPLFGSRALTSGFTPDPSTIPVVGVPSVDVSYLGGGCRGFTTTAPTFSVQYTSGSFTLLRFYFVGSGDPVMVVNNPSGGYSCNDDSFGTLNPAISFNNPASGRYDIWVGSLRAGETATGTLFITEIDANRP